jgi:hypothetical protein
MYKQKKIGILEAVMCVFATLIAANIEQGCLILGGIFVFALGVFYYKYKRIQPLIMIQLGCIMADVVLFVLSPGNKYRYFEEITLRLPEYASWNVFDKAFFGLKHFLDIFFACSYVLELFLLFIAVTLVAAYFRNKSKVEILLLGVTLCLGFFVWQIGVDANIVLEHANDLRWSYLLVLGLVLCAIYSLYRLWGNDIIFYNALVIISLCALSVIIIGFSPTLYASHLRIYLFFIYALIGEILYISVKYDVKIPVLKSMVFLFSGYWFLLSYGRIFEYLLFGE